MAKLQEVTCRCRACGARSPNLLDVEDGDMAPFLVRTGWSRMQRPGGWWLCSVCARTPETSSVMAVLRDLR